MFKIFNLLTSTQKKTFFLIVFFIILLSLVEILTFSLLHPIINFYSENSSENIFINKIDLIKTLKVYEILGLFFIFFIIRAVLYIYISFKKNQFIYNINNFLSSRIFENYINQEYFFFIENKTSDMISVIINEVEKFAYRLIDNIINLFTETFIVSAILIFLLINFFNETIILSLATITFFSIFYFFFKSKFKKLGNEKTLSDAKKINNLQNSFFAIQPIKLEGLEFLFSQKFFISTKKSARSQFHLGFMSELPKPLIEFLVLIIVFLMLFFSYLYSHLSNKEILSTLAIFVVAMFRLLPSTNRIIGSLNVIKFYSSSGKIINEELNRKFLKLNNSSENQMFKSINFNSTIKLENICFSYPSSEKKILNNANLIINKNQMIAIVGGNGSGKSTLLNIICCLLRPEKGKIYVDGIDIEDNQRVLQKKIGFVQQRTFIVDDTLLNNIIFGRQFKTENYLHLQEVIKDSNLQSFVDNLPKGLETNLDEMGRNLSGGEMQKIGIARALYKKSEILLLDEATSALDENAEEEILNTITKLKKKVTIIAITHKKDFLKYCDNVYNIKDLQNN
jgi:ABC-type bacteriocin/lantibiotic exporter with double-glycine peptidase domain